nr:xanthine dehydrogenase accessory protein XdhC [Fournierella massiliensis]
MNQGMKQLARRLETEPAVLVTILESKGSAPRHAGAFMAVLAGGESIGTIGGGRVEAVCQQRAARALAEQQSAVEEYDLNDRGPNQVGMACGGQVRVEFLYLPAGRESAQELARRAAQSGSGRVLLFGAGHVARALAALLPALEFEYWVVDDRPEFAVKDAFPGAAGVLCEEMAAAVNRLEPTEEDLIVIMTRGHEHDYEVLREALATPAGYIGLMGSRRKIAMTRQKLEEEGFGPEQFARVSTPIGLSIGAETPAEIAVSVAAQLLPWWAEHRGQGAKPLDLIHS